MYIRAIKNISDEIEKTATGNVFDMFFKFFNSQLKKIENDIEKNNGTNIQTIINNDIDDFKRIMAESYISTIDKFAGMIRYKKRAADDNISMQLMEDILKIVGIEEGLITETTINKIHAVLEKNLEAGGSMQDFQQAIIDSGILSPERALLIARTTTTGAANWGQVIGAKETGATHKEWSFSPSPDSRKSHERMNGKQVLIDDLFVVDGEKCHYPGDHTLSAANRCNCRCNMYFLIKD